MPRTRRDYLIAATAVLPFSAGCVERAESTGATPTGTNTGTTTADGTEPEETAGSVTVVRSRTSARAPTDWERTLTVSTADGCVTETLVCGGDTLSDSALLSETELEPFRELADGASVASLDSRYACEGRCPTDVPATTLTITTPDVERTVVVEAGAETPELLDRLTSALDTASQHVSAGSCGPAARTETP